ncbi:unnamed protein product [Protopolystoma xenopodis]|uniref:Uncharacterized protein n=1 Tax=Protopolystoma xenopodis TaxID=117903 RepID=A0A3S5BUG0_9PLAT|nr:unnamed protein product [Protopolystoma xenopodis]
MTSRLGTWLSPGDENWAVGADWRVIQASEGLLTPVGDKCDSCGFSVDAFMCHFTSLHPPPPRSTVTTRQGGRGHFSWPAILCKCVHVCLCVCTVSQPPPSLLTVVSILQTPVRRVNWACFQGGDDQMI